MSIFLKKNLISRSVRLLFGTLHSLLGPIMSLSPVTLTQAWGGGGVGRGVRRRTPARLPAGRWGAR